MPWSFQIARAFGIPIRLHATFLLLLGWIAFAGIARGDLTQTLVALGLFTCVVAHELGHSVVAQRYGVHVVDITLLPIGGVARMATVPRNPHQEFWISIAGPLVNFVLAPLFMLLHQIVEPASAGLPWIAVLASPGWVLLKLAMLNLTLGLFNLIPAFPMDGGRILRALLAQRMPYERATRYATGLGQCLAFLLALVGLLAQSSPMLVFIALFIFIGAGEEGVRVQTHAVIEGAVVREAMVTTYATLRRGDTLRTAVELLLAGAQQDFPVVEGDDVVGVLTRRRLLEVLSHEGNNRYVSEVMEPAPASVGPEEPLEEVMDQFGPAGVGVIPVVGPDGLCGLLTKENAVEFILVRAALRRNQERRAA